MKKNPNILWIPAILLGWLFDFLFWKKPAGINFAIYSLLCLAGGLVLLRIDRQRMGRGAWPLIPLILFFAAVTFVRAEPMTAFLGVAFTLFLMALLAMTYAGGRWFWYSLADYFYGFLKLAGSMLARPLAFSAEVKREQDERGARRPAFNLWPILRGVVIALPVLAIFAALLASADVIFGQRLDEFIKLFKLEKLPEYIFRLIYILFGAYLLAGAFLHAASQSRDEKLLGEDKPLTDALLGFTESAIVLGSVAVLFLAFVVVQFRYFFGGQANIHIDGYTYSEYARRGFGELVTVAFFSLLMILGLSSVTRREAVLHKRLYSGLSVLIVALVMVMLVSAYQRLALYEVAYGFSELRTYTHVFLFWIGLLLGAVAVLEVLHRERAFALAALLCSIGFAASLSLLNVDAFIVRQNVDLAVRGQRELDAPYLAQLSDDAVPAIAEAYRSSSAPASVKEAAGAALACLRVHRDDSKDRPWQSSHFARAGADNIFTSLKTDLDGYVYSGDQWPYHVTSPQGRDFNCYGYSD